MPCHSGCVCPDGLVKHEDECFKPEECPCLWKGKEYFPGDLVKSPCYICVCQRGMFQCTFQPCPSVCTAYGDRHFKTFDGVHYDFMSNCEVYLVKSHGSLNLSITAENIDCYGSGAVCRKTLSILVGNSSLVFDDDNGKLSPSSFMDTKQTIQIWKAGLFTMIHFPAEDISILWDERTTTHIQVGPRWQGKLSGLCGNFDLKTVNEMRTPDQMEAPNPQEFGTSWTAMECASSPDVRNPCHLNPLREPFAKKECGILLCDVFEPCHAVVDVTWFYSNCLADTCACNRGGDCECFCTSVLAYAQTCCQHGVAIDWRTPTICPYDCEYYNKVLGKGPYSLVTYLDAGTVVAADLLSGTVFPATRAISIPGVVTLFMLTPGLHLPKPHDVSLVSLEVADKPNYFLRARFDGSLHISKWEFSATFRKEATFKFHKDAWVWGYNAFESYSRHGFYIHLASSTLHLLKYNHSQGFRRATLFQLQDAEVLSPVYSTCEWRYETCVNPCIRTCRDPTGDVCQDLPSVEGCMPRCPMDMLFDEDTQRCVYPQDCIRPALYIQPSKSTSALPGVPTTPAFNASVQPLTSITVAELGQAASSPTTSSTTKVSVPTSTVKTPPVTQLATSASALPAGPAPAPSSVEAVTSAHETTSRTTLTTEQALVPSTTSYMSPTSTLGVSARIITTKATTVLEMSTPTEATKPTQLPTESHLPSATIEPRRTVTTRAPSTTTTGVTLPTAWRPTTTKTIPSQTEPSPEKTSHSTLVAHPPTEKTSTIQTTSAPQTLEITSTYPTSKELQPTVPPTLSATTAKSTSPRSPHITVYPWSTATVSLTTEKTKSSSTLGAYKLSATTVQAFRPSTKELTAPSTILITETYKTTTPSVSERTITFPLSTRIHPTTTPPATDLGLTTLRTTTKEVSPTSTTTLHSTASTTVSSKTTALETSMPVAFPNMTTAWYLEQSYPSPSTKRPESGPTVERFQTTSTRQSTEMTASSTAELHSSGTSISPQPTTAMRFTTTHTTTQFETSSLQPLITSTTAIPTSTPRVSRPTSTLKTTTVTTQLGTTTVLPTLLARTSAESSTVAAEVTSETTETVRAINATVTAFSLSTATTPTSVPRTTTASVTTLPLDIDGTKPTTVLFKTPLATETSAVSVHEASATSAGVNKTTASPATSTRPATETEKDVGKTAPSPRLMSTVETVSVGLNGTLPTTSKVTSVKYESTTTQSSTASESPPSTLSNVTSLAVTSAGVLESVAGPTVFTATASSTGLTVAPTSHCTIPFPQDVDECVTQICVEGQVMQINRSHHCPQIVIPPSCEFRGFAVQVNTDKCCPQWECPCRCSILANLHIITSDGYGFGISGAASYIIASTANETITVGISECLNNQMTTMMQPQVNSTYICLTKLNVTHGSNIVIIDQQRRTLNVNSKLAYTPFRRFGFEIVDTGSMYTIVTPAGIVIQWFHSTRIMVINTGTPSKKLATLGLCGFCDGNPTNDLTFKNGTVLGKDVDPGIFAEEWTVASTETGIKMIRQHEMNCSTGNCSECFKMLQSETFAPCHAQVSPEMFCELWIRDSLFVHNPCSALGAYVALCNKFSICLDWRRPDYCAFTCPPNMIYQACVLTCEAKTCQNRIFFPSEDTSCPTISEGCVCPDGSILHRLDSTLCIPEAKCACTDSWGLPHAGGDMWNASVDGCCMYQCLENGTIVTVDHDCSAVPEPVCRGSGEVVVNLAGDQSCCPEKICACNQTVCTSFAPQCSYGERLITLYKPDFCCPDYFCECDPEKCGSDIPICREDQTLIATRADGSCCLAYICMCGACSDQIPTCSEGEMITVDNNTMEMCCPNYQCVCEINRCPKFQCPTGMQELHAWSPDRCCPVHSCECSCETFPKPQCKLGELLVNEQQFGNTTANPCACPEYKCVNDKVCIDGERGTLRPGQVIVEHTTDGLCYTTQCTHNLDNQTGIYSLLVNMVNCSAQCEMNQVYIPPDDPTTCCGVCKNVSCLDNLENENTTFHKPGTSWVSNCVRYDCTDTVSGPVLIASNIICPPFNKTACLKIGGSVITYMDGCCQSCKEDVKSCQKVVVRMTIRKNDCRSNRPVNIVSCDGKCPSASIYNYSINTHARFCKCCREIGLQKRMVQLYCSSNTTWVNYPIQEPTDCSCLWS